MSASEIARQALGIGVDEIETIAREATSGLGAAAKLGARARGTAGSDEIARAGGSVVQPTPPLHRPFRARPCRRTTGPRGAIVNVCAREGCKQPFEPRKPNQRFHRSSCRDRDWRDHNPRRLIHTGPTTSTIITDDVTIRVTQLARR